MWSPWCVEAGWPQQIARNCWFALLNVLFWQICSTTDSPREPSLVALSNAWSLCFTQILAWVLVNHLQLFINDLIRPEQKNAIKGRSIQDNLHLVCEVPEELRDGTEAVLINLDQSKVFDRVDYQFLASVLETVWFKPEFCKWVSMMYYNPQWCRLSQLSNQSGRVAPCLLFFMSLLWSPCSVGLGMRRYVQPYASFFLPALFQQRYPCTLMISLSLCPAVYT